MTAVVRPCSHLDVGEIGTLAWEVGELPLS